jgi:hypothetical protein
MENVYTVVTRECGPVYGPTRARRLLKHYTVPVHVACTRHAGYRQVADRAAGAPAYLRIGPSRPPKRPYAMSDSKLCLVPARGRDARAQA